jgi:shikimate kinase
MSTLARWREARAVLEWVDPVLAPALLSSWDALKPLSFEPLHVRGHVVLVGHRAAGKTTLLGPVATLVRREALDLDAQITRHAGVPVATVFKKGEAAFRALEREVFTLVDGARVIAAGGGFLSHHADLLTGHLAVLVPVSLQTYRRRLAAKAGARPRLHPSMTLADEITTVFTQREAVHAGAPTMPLLEFLARAGSTP